jgi:hypothetical protein
MTIQFDAQTLAHLESLMEEYTSVAAAHCSDDDDEED